MIISLDEIKNYLRIDYDDDDTLLKNLIFSSERLCMDIARTDNRDEFENMEPSKIAVMYAVAYQYEHREDCNHLVLMMSLRSLLSGIRKDKF